MAYEGSYIVFVNSKSAEKCEAGVALMDEESLVSKGSYGFANFFSTATVIPNSYRTIDFFNNNGVPCKIYVGEYGTSIFIKEVYLNHREIIKGFLPHGERVIYEIRFKPGKENENPFYTRLNNAVGEWRDETDNLSGVILQSLFEKKCKVDLSNGLVRNALAKKNALEVYRTENGVVLVDGRYETLAIWTDDCDRVCMTWLGRKIAYKLYNCENITKDVENLFR